MTDAHRPQLVELSIGDAAAAWSELGFTVGDDGVLSVGGVMLNLASGGAGITRWTLSGIASVDAIDGLPTTVVPALDRSGDGGGPGWDHANTAVGLDHVVVTTPAFDRFAAALDDVGMPLRRIREVGSGEHGFRQGFRRLGPAILEVVELKKDQPLDGPSRFWGLVVNVADLDGLAERLGPERCSAPKDAVQPGRRIVTLKRSPGITPAIAFMTPE